MKKIQINNTEKIYTLEDLPKLKERNIYLRDTVVEMIELGVINGDYEKEVLSDDGFIDRYLLEELNSGFIKVKNELGEDGYEGRVKELRVAIEGNRGKLEDVFEFITINHGEGNFDFTDYAFLYEDIAITNPFMDETARFDVDPISYYGKKFVGSKMAKMILDYCNWIS